MVWFCNLCHRPAEMVFAIKCADIYDVVVGDACISCIREKAETMVSMEKEDMIGIGYTLAALQEGALQLMKCPSCHKYRDIIMVSKPETCCSCFNYFMYKMDDNSSW
jgi:hypothetical protein